MSRKHLSVFEANLPVPKEQLVDKTGIDFPKVWNVDKVRQGRQPDEGPILILSCEGRRLHVPKSHLRQVDYDARQGLLYLTDADLSAIFLRRGDSVLTSSVAMRKVPKVVVRSLNYQQKREQLTEELQRYKERYSAARRLEIRLCKTEKGEPRCDQASRQFVYDEKIVELAVLARGNDREKILDHAMSLLPFGHFLRIYDIQDQQLEPLLVETLPVKSVLFPNGISHLSEPVVCQ